MTTYTGRQTVHAGLYLNTATYHMESLNADGTLPGTELQTYWRVPMLAMLAVAPLLGLAFVMFLPFVGFAVMLKLVGTKVLQLVGGAAADGVRVLRPSWAPALAFLTRSKPGNRDEKSAGNPANDAWKEDVEKKLNDDDHQA